MSDCIEWQGQVNGSGYGRGEISVGPGRRYKVPVHRFAWENEHGPIPDGLFVCHHCDNRRCVNVEHLFLGTARDNALDMVRKGRNVPGCLFGESNPQTRLTNAEVMEIRHRAATGVTRTALAREYGMSQSRISDIVNGRTWRHLPLTS